MVGGDVLRGAVPRDGGLSGSENGKVGIAVGRKPVPGALQIAKNGVVGTVFLDDVDDVPDGRRALEKARFVGAEQTVVLQCLARVVRQLPVIRQRDAAERSGHKGDTVLPALPSRFRFRREAIVGRVGKPPGGVGYNRGVFKAGAFAIADNQRPADDGNGRRIKPGWDEAFDNGGLLPSLRLGGGLRFGTDFRFARRLFLTQTDDALRMRHDVVRLAVPARPA